MLTLTTPEMINAVQSERRKEADDFRRARRFAKARRTRRTGHEPALMRPAYRLAWTARR